MSCIVTVDTNSGEDFIFEGLTSSFKGGEVVRCRLDVGDVQIEKGDVKLIVERKTWNDLRSSLSDGRYAEQKARAMGSKEEGCEFCYLIEGQCPDWSASSYHGARCAAVKMSVRDKIPVFMTKSKDETSSLIEYLANQVNNGNLYTSSSSASVGTSCSKRKRDNLDDPASVLTAMLSVIPGMSTKKAKVVVEELKCVDGIRSASEKRLSELPVGGRKLGPSLAKKMKAVFPSPVETKVEGGNLE